MARLKFYPVEIDYRINDDRASIQLFGRTPEGRQVCVQDKGFLPYFYVYSAKRGPEELLSAMKTLSVIKYERQIRPSKAELIDRKLLGKKVKCVKVTSAFPRDMLDLAQEVRRSYPDTEVFEDDVPFTRRYLIDKGVFPLALTDAEGEFINQRSRVSVFEASLVMPSSTELITKLKVLSLDIEVDNPRGRHVNPATDPIIMVALYSETGRRVIVSKSYSSKLEYVEHVESEAELIARLAEHISKTKPDIITGYNSSAFDLPYIAQRAEKHGIRLDLGLDYSFLKIDKRGEGKAAIAGISHLDVLALVKKPLSPLVRQKFSNLDELAHSLTGKERNHPDLRSLHEVFMERPFMLDEYCERCLGGAELSYNALEKLIPDLTELTKLIGLTMQDLSRMPYSQLVEWYLSRRAYELGELLPQRPEGKEFFIRRTESSQGGVVHEPRPGIHSDIAVFDFRSLYPTIIASHNISPDSLNCTCCEGENQPPGEHNWFCKNKRGFISSVIEELISRRLRIIEIIRREGRSDALDARETILKSLANTMYGYLGFPQARWYSRECVSAITAYGRYYESTLIERAEKGGFSVIYSDTDSVFISLEGRPVEEAKKFAEMFSMSIPESMALEFEGYYPKGLFAHAKDSDGGAKKKYAMLRVDGKLTIKGFEAVRGNEPLVARNVQYKALKTILNEGTPDTGLAYLKRVVTKLRAHEIPVDQLIITTVLQRRIDSYETITPHVAAAKRMMDQGIEVSPGTVIRYVVCSDGKLVREKARLPEECNQQDYDAEYYIHSQLIPAVETVFSLFGISRDELLGEQDQSSLQEYI